MRSYFVYMLHCADDSYYTGITNDVSRRVEEHAVGLHPSSYTFSRRPCTLVYSEKFKYVLNAIAREKQIKRWSHEKKKALAAGNKRLLKLRASRRGGKPRKAT